MHILSIAAVKTHLSNFVLDCLFAAVSTSRCSSAFQQCAKLGSYGCHLVFSWEASRVLCSAVAIYTLRMQFMRSVIPVRCGRRSCKQGLTEDRSRVVGSVDGFLQGGRFPRGIWPVLAVRYTCNSCSAIHVLHRWVFGSCGWWRRH
jgi:hypothetical protein